jgi:MYXO-CTERM domain-containing protein
VTRADSLRRRGTLILLFAAASTPAAAPAAAPARGDSIPIGIENVNDSPLKDGSYRALLRFVPDATVTIDRFYFGFKLRGASCWDAGQAGYGKGDGGTLEASLVDINPATGLPSTVLKTETVNGCTRHDQAAAELGSGDPVLVWVDTPATLEGNKMYGLVVRNAHASPAANYFSFNMPLADTTLAGPHARNELNARAPGAILSLDPREHVAWSTDGGTTWHYGSENGQYRSYMNNHDTAHPATRMPQYGWRRSDGVTVAQQPYYAYNDDCTGCSVTYANARYARTFTMVGGFIASASANVGTLTFTNVSTGATASCAAPAGYGFRTCTLPSPIAVAVGQDYRVAATGAVEVMRLDFPQRTMFPGVGTRTGELRSFQATPGPGTNAKDVPNLWAGPVSAQFPGGGDGAGTNDAAVTDAKTNANNDAKADAEQTDASLADAVGIEGSGGTASVGGSAGGSRTGTAGTTGSAGVTGAGASMAGSIGAAGSGSAGTSSAASSGSSGGCSCRLADDHRSAPGAALLALAIGLAGLRRRRSL